MGKSVNGQIYDFVHIKLMLPSGVTQFLQSIDWDDQVDSEVVTKTNGLPGGVAEGEYSGSVKISMAKSDADMFENEAAAVGGFYNLGEIPIVVTYGNQNSQPPTQDEIFCVITKRTKGNKKSDKSLQREYEGLLTAPVVSNGIPAVTRA